jgi:hypothetical protein
MHCPWCGKSIPNESIYCMFCGKHMPERSETPIPQVTTPQTSSSYNSNPAVAIEKVSFWPIGDVELKPAKGPFGTKQYGRGFEMWITLVDASDRQVVSDGTLIITLNYWSPNRNYVFKYSRDIRGVSDEIKRDLAAKNINLKQISFLAAIPISRKDFEVGSLVYTRSRVVKQVLHCSYRHVKPLIFVAEPYDSDITRVFAQVIFKTPEGKLLYKEAKHRGWQK